MTADTAIAGTTSESPAQLRRRITWMYIWAATFAGPGLSVGIVLARNAFSRGLPFDQPSKLHILWAAVLLSLAVEAMLPIIRTFRNAHTRGHAFIALLVAAITGIIIAWLASIGVGE